MNKEMKFEEAISKLEDAVRLLEGGTLSLDESIDKYEEALKYVKICSETLAKAEQKVKILTESADGSISDRPFVYDEN
jgi:exodeoxyribonuclease VII small subunit